LITDAFWGEDGANQKFWETYYRKWNYCEILSTYQ
jgi:hypothetical protein